LSEGLGKFPLALKVDMTTLKRSVGIHAPVGVADEPIPTSTMSQTLISHAATVVAMSAHAMSRSRHT
jgi:hypothetical protein